MQKDKRLLSLLGLARRAGALTVGQDKVAENCKSSNGLLVFVSCDISENVIRMLKTAVENKTAEVYKTEFDRQTLGNAIGVQTAQIVAVTKDSSFGNNLLSYMKRSDANE